MSDEWKIRLIEYAAGATLIAIVLSIPFLFGLMLRFIEVTFKFGMSLL